MDFFSISYGSNVICPVRPVPVRACIGSCALGNFAYFTLVANVLWPSVASDCLGDGKVDCLAGISNPYSYTVGESLPLNCFFDHFSGSPTPCPGKVSVDKHCTKNGVFWPTPPSSLSSSDISLTQPVFIDNTLLPGDVVVCKLIGSYTTTALKKVYINLYDTLTLQVP